MTDSHLLTDPLDRRTFLRRGGIGAAAVTAAGLIITRTGTASAAPRARRSSLQGNWAWCQLCSEIIASFRGSGTCPAQPYNGHAIGTWRYSEVYGQGTTGGLPNTPGYQAGWYFCSQCYALVYGGSNPAASCPGNGGQHSHNLSGSYNYAMPVGITGPAYQGGWNWCNQCGCQYHSNQGWGYPAGFCWVVWNKSQGVYQNHNPGGAWPYTMIH
jgi:hypothetical protein